MVVRKISRAEFALLHAAAPTNTILPASWWAQFLSLFLNRDYTETEARRLLELYNEKCGNFATVKTA